MKQTRSSYKQIFKATSIFGGVQVFNVLISVLRAKFIAVIVGPSGIGIFGLITTTISLISSITSFGLGASSIKDIAVANQNNDNQKFLSVVGILNKLVWYTGGLGMILTFIFSPLLSLLTFGNFDYTWSFIFLSITLLIGQLTLGKDAILQGTRQLKWLAYANMLSSAISLILTLPLYIFYGRDGIVPSMIIISCVTLIVTQFYFKRLNIIIPHINIKDSWEKGKGMLQLGFFLSLSGIIATSCAYGVRIFISRIGNLELVGLYNAGFGIINSYVGIIFTAMATDYYPRLSAVINNRKKFTTIVNQQGNVAMIILGPILTAFIVFVNFAIIVLYSKDFLPIQQMMQYAIIGVFFKASSWLLSFIILAKGDTKTYFWSELFSNVIHSVLYCLGFYYWRLEGLGIAFILGYILYMFQMLMITKYKYNFYFTKEFIKIFTLQILISISALILILISKNKLTTYTIGVILIILTSIISISKLNKLANLSEIIKKILRRN